MVLLSDWSVLCLNHELKLLWKVQPLKEEQDQNLAIRFSSRTLSNSVLNIQFHVSFREASVLVSHVSIQKGDTGCVIVGGRVSKKPAPKIASRGTIYNNTCDLLRGLS